MNRSYSIPLKFSNVLVTVVLIMLGWALPWLPWIAVRSAGARAAPRPVPVVSYVRTSEGVEGAAWSPVLCSLPRRDGFSGSVRENRDARVRFLKPQLADAVYLGGNGWESAGVAPAVGVRGLVEADLQRERFQPRPVGDAVFASAVPTGVEVCVSGDLQGYGFDAPGLRDMQTYAGLAPWTPFAARVEVGEQGRVAHVFMEQSTGKPDVDAALIKGLYRGTVQGAARACAGGVKVVYVGPPDSRKAGSGENVLP